MSRDSFKEDLIRLEMLPNGDAPNLFFVSDKIAVANPHIRVALEQAEKYKADGVFFRMFPDDSNRSPLAQVYIYHNTALSWHQDGYAELHRRLWNAGVVPLVFIFTAGQIKVLNCRQEPEIDEITKKPIYRPFRKFEDLIVAEQAFVTRAILAGTLWDDPAYASDFRLQKTAYYKLLSHLKAFRRKLVGLNILSESLANRLLVMAILVKYLNDRKDSEGNAVFHRGFFSQFSGHKSDDLDLVFSKPQSCIKLFDYLALHFNGGIFRLSENEKTELLNADLRLIAKFLRGDETPTGQGLLFWPIYSFEDLPVELISNIYEEFLAKENSDDSRGIIYTPPMLVDFLLDQCMPLDPATLRWRILDPACGSGVFLVGAFRRLIHCWRMANNWKRPTHGDLQQILKNSIFGFDRESEAILVAAFSLCVALCNELDPLVIWNELRFDNLQTNNLQTTDFFAIVESGAFKNHFNLIIGNPPFESDLTSQASKDVEAKNAASRPKLPDNQVALLFLEQSFQLLRDGSNVCLIQPAGPLLYNGNGQEFREYIFSKFNIDCVLDFTPLEGVLFAAAKVAAAAIIARNSTDSTDGVLHITFRRTRAIREKMFFELDPYDFHWVRSSLVKDRFVWKANLLGGGRLRKMIGRLFADFSTLRDYLTRKQENEGWQFGEGYNVGCGAELNKLPNAKELTQFSAAELKKRFKLKRSPKTAEWITGKANVPPTALTKNGIEWESVKPCEHLFFQDRSSTIRPIFSAPHVLIREKLDGFSIPSISLDVDVVFSKQIMGIHAPAKDKDKLDALATRLNDSKLYGILAATVSSRTLVSRASSLLQSDILALPYPEDGQELTLNKWEEALVDDIANFLVEFRLTGEKAAILKKTNREDLISFGDMYCRILNPIYKRFHPLEYLHFGSFICYPFCYGETPEIEELDSHSTTSYLDQLLHQRLCKHLLVNRILRSYEQNVIVMVKPDQKRYWLRSTAIRDADETLVDLLEQGY